MAHVRIKTNVCHHQREHPCAVWQRCRNQVCWILDHGRTVTPGIRGRW